MDNIPFVGTYFLGVLFFFWGGGVLLDSQRKNAQDIRDFRDFRAYDKLDVRFGREWKQAEVLEVDWEECHIRTALGFAKKDELNTPLKTNYPTWWALEKITP